MVGGIAGSNVGIIRNCYAVVDITGAGSVRNNFGGIAGSNVGTITHCYALGTVIGARYIGGITETNSGTVTNCVALQTRVEGQLDVGRVAGMISGSGSLNNNYARAAGMTLVTGGGAVTPSATGIHGADVAAAQTHQGSSDTWWSSTLGFTTANWSFAANRLPHLRTTHNTRFDEVQIPTVR